MNTLHSDADALVFGGDVTFGSTQDEWDYLNKLFAILDIPVYFVPGNHDVASPKQEQVWLDNVGYTSKSVDIGYCNLLLLNSVNQKVLQYEKLAMIAGGGLDADSKSILKGLVDPDNEMNFAFMHHTLYSTEIFMTGTLDRAIARGGYHPIIYENMEEWSGEIQNMIKDKVSAVYIGDRHNVRSTRMEIDGVKYIGNAFGLPGRPFTYVTIEAANGEFTNNIHYLPVPFDSEWYKFSTDAFFWN